MLATAEARIARASGLAEQAILRTVTYAGLFQYPLRLEQLERGLMDVPASRDEILDALCQPFLRQRVAQRDGCVFPIGCEHWLELREQRRVHTARLLETHAAALRWLAGLPFVRLVALSGACAHQNATDPDVDVFLITQPDRAWAVTLEITLWSHLQGLRKSLCVNYVIDEQALALPERDLFTAAEVVGLQPLAGRTTYQRFVAANAWVAERFPNFFAGHRAEWDGIGEAGAPRWVERLLDLAPAPVVEWVSRVWLGRRLRAKGAGSPGVSLSPHRLKLHTLDHAPRLRAAFAEAVGEDRL